MPPESGRAACLLPPRATWREDLRRLPIDDRQGVVTVTGPDGTIERRALAPQEQAALWPLLLHRVASHDRLYSALWGLWLEPPESCATGLRVAICSLRRKLEGSGAVILTLAAIGYRLEVAANDNRRRAA